MNSDDEPSSPQDLAAQARNAFALILAKLGRRDHTEKELLSALGRKGYAEEAAMAALGRAKREGLVNDERLAGAIPTIKSSRCFATRITSARTWRWRSAVSRSSGI